MGRDVDPMNAGQRTSIQQALEMVAVVDSRLSKSGEIECVVKIMQMEALTTQDAFIA